jgi:hypothetical protein
LGVRGHNWSPEIEFGRFLCAPVARARPLEPKMATNSSETTGLAQRAYAFFAYPAIVCLCTIHVFSWFGKLSRNPALLALRLARAKGHDALQDRRLRRQAPKPPFGF